MPLPIDPPSLAWPALGAQGARTQRTHRLPAALNAALLCTWVAVSGCAGLHPLPAPAPASAPLPAPVVVPAPPAAPAPPPMPDAAALADAAARRLLAFNERLREMGPVDLVREQARMSEALDASGPAPGSGQIQAPSQAPSQAPGQAATQAPAQALELALVLAQRQQPGDLARAVALLEPLTRATAPAPWQAPARLLHARLYEQRKLEEQLERQALQLRDQQRRLEQLAAQLEALKAIERSLNNPRTPPPSPAPAPRP